LDKWREGFIEHAAPNDPKSFPFVLLGNKVDREPERKVQTQRAQDWCKEKGGITYYETSAKENIHVDDAFIEMARMAISRESQNQIFMPESISGAGGALKLNTADDNRRTKQLKKKNAGCPC
jgi:Ras-related protein Rab-7A